MGVITYPCPRSCIDDVRWTGPCLSMSSDFQLHGIIGPCSNKILPWFNTLRPRQDGRHFPDNIFKCIFLNENVSISLKFVPKSPINNTPAMVQIMAWRRPGDKPLSEPMVISLPMHICVTRPQWVNVLTVIIAMSSSGAFLLTRLNFNPSMIRSHAQRWNEIEYPFLNNHWSLGMHK